MELHRCKGQSLVFDGHHHVMLVVGDDIQFVGYFFGHCQQGMIAANPAIGFDAVKHLVLCRAERRPPRLDLDIYPYLPRATVETTSAKAYMRLLDREEEPA